MKPFSTVLIILTLCFLSCQHPIVPDCQSSDTTLHTHFAHPVGVAVDVEALSQNEAYRDLISRQFNSITPENIFKPKYLQPEPGQFAWEEADELVAYCQQEGKRLHGHTLVWHNQLPAWMDQFEGTEAAWDSMMKTHIQTVVNHFKGVVSSWDVVNEAFEDDGTFRDNIWHQHLGDAYLEKAFRYAHAADTAVLLFYNDYSVAAKDKKREAILNWSNGLREKGVPIDGIGLQMHIGHNQPSNRALEKTIREVWENEYLVHLSELDVSINRLEREMDSPPAKKLQSQADRYAFVFQTYQQVPAAYQHGITMWGLSDRDSWIPSFFERDDYPLLFDADYLPKPAYCRLVELE